MNAKWLNERLDDISRYAIIGHQFQDRQTQSPWIQTPRICPWYLSSFTGEVTQAFPNTNTTWSNSNLRHVSVGRKKRKFPMVHSKVIWKGKQMEATVQRKFLYGQPMNPIFYLYYQELIEAFPCFVPFNFSVHPMGLTAHPIRWHRSDLSRMVMPSMSLLITCTWLL